MFMNKMLIVCLVVLSLLIVACSPQRAAEQDTTPAVSGGEAAPGSDSVQDVGSGVSDVDALTTELDSSDADGAAGELEKLNW